MSATHSKLLLHAFRRFSVLKALRTAPATVWHYVNPNPLPASDKPVLFSMNILPPMATVWYHLVQKHLGDSVDTVLFDCSGSLQSADFPGARVQPFMNFYAAKKSDEFLQKIAKHRRIGWICDDDMFIMSSKVLSILNREFTDPNTACVSFRPRGWWHFDIDGQQYEPASSYCTAINRKIVIEKEHLSLAPSDGNTHVSHLDKPLKRYDTFDKANEVLLQKGYRCAIVPQEEREECVTGFAGTSSAVMLLWYFKKPEQMTDFLLSPPKKTWQGNTLFTVLSGLLAACTMQELHTKITGSPWPLPSLPSRRVLEKIRSDHEQYLREDHSFELVDSVSERLRNAI